MADLWNVQETWARHAPREYDHSSAPLHGALTLCAAGVGSCTCIRSPPPRVPFGDAEGDDTGFCAGRCTSRRGIIGGEGFAYHCCSDIHRGWRKLEGLAYLSSQLLRLQSHPKHNTHGGVRLRALHGIPLVAAQRLPD